MVIGSQGLRTAKSLFVPTREWPPDVGKFDHGSVIAAITGFETMLGDGLLARQGKTDSRHQYI
jgi:hypothetical protein